MKELEFNRENRDNIIRWTISIVLPLGGALYKIIFKRRLDSPSPGQVKKIKLCVSGVNFLVFFGLEFTCAFFGLDRFFG